MPFYFLKYLQSTHYFRLLTKSGASIFPKIEALPHEVIEKLQRECNYQSITAQDYDMSWQAVHNGYIGNAETYENFEEVSIHDNYCFIRRYFHKAWVLYVFLVRLVSFHNPIKEVKAWMATGHIRRHQDGITPVTYPKWESFQSSLIKRAPKVSVLIPTLNRYEHLRNVLKDFETQDYSNFEILVIDQSEPFKPEFYSEFDLDIKLIRQEEKALWLARNTGIETSTGELIALSEDDVRINNDWISNHLKCLDFFNAQVSAGVFYPKGQDIPNDRSFFAIGSQFATGNAMLYKDVFRATGLFDRQFEKQRMGDGEFGTRVYLEGIKSISNPYASCIDVKAGSGGLREMGSWDSFRPSSFFSPRPIPSVLYYFRRYFGNSAARWSLLRTIPISIFPYQFKKNKPLLILGSLLSLLLLPLVCFQVMKSWHLSTIKLKKGPIINSLS